MGENNNQQDPRLIQPEIIGELRKDKIGKPLLVIELFLLFGIVFAALPMIHEELNDDNSQLYQLIYGKKTVVDTAEPTDNNKVDIKDGSQPNLLAFDTVMKFDNIILKNFELSDGRVSCTMYATSTAKVDLDKKDYYLEISSSSDQVLGAVKLVGIFDNIEQHVKLDVYGVQFNSNLSYTGKIVEMKDENYPEIELNEDMNGYANLVCSKDQRTIKYSFQNKYLIKLEDNVYVSVSDNSDDEYINKLQEYQEKATKLGVSTALVDEIADGFQFRALIDYDTEYKIPDSVVDYNYYPENTLAKKIAYAQKSKGFDCK